MLWPVSRVNLSNLQAEVVVGSKMSMSFRFGLGIDRLVPLTWEVLRCVFGRWSNCLTSASVQACQELLPFSPQLRVSGPLNPKTLNPKTLKPQANPKALSSLAVAALNFGVDLLLGFEFRTWGQRRNAPKCREFVHRMNSNHDTQSFRSAV